GAFRDWIGLTTVSIGSGVTSIGGFAFFGCSGLTSINIPDSVTAIGQDTFHGCSGLTSIDIPDGVTSIGHYAFEDCSGLTSVYCRPTTPPTLGADAFNSNASDRKIYVPTSSTDAYQAAENWSSYADAIVGYDF
ncbi:MAG: leucine-rich repeat domain-containing protein, partial [Alistipes sp.]|nr:leucine-rich repeat domain-containing protein [Alistipes sp.]